MIKEKIIFKHLKLSNILFSINSINKINIKLSIYISNEFNKISSKTNLDNNSLTISPQILKGENYSNKTDLWSLGVIIYYMLFKEYPFNGKLEYQIIKDIESKKELKEIKHKELKDLVHQMLLINENERISWNGYFNHTFFKIIILEEIEFPEFDFICKKHLDNFNYYCKKCKCNICEICKKEHNLHEIIPFSHIGLNNIELKEMENLIDEFENNINIQIKFKKNIQNLINKIKSINKNNSLYEDDSKYNYKNYYINCLKLLNEEIKIKENIKYIELDKLKINNIICEYQSKNINIYLEDKILNCFEVARNENSSIKGKENEKEIKDNCELYINGKKLDFCFEYIFK